MLQLFSDGIAQTQRLYEKPDEPWLEGASESSFGQNGISRTCETIFQVVAVRRPCAVPPFASRLSGSKAHRIKRSEQQLSTHRMPTARTPTTRTSTWQHLKCADLMQGAFCELIEN